MSRTTNQFSAPYVNVEAVPVSAGGQTINKVAIQLPDDDGNVQTVGLHNVGYTLIPNSVARDVADDIMHRSKLDWCPLGSGSNWNEKRRQETVLFDGKHYIARYISRNAIAEVTNGRNHPLHMGLMVRNSYDGSSVFGVEMFAFNLVCANQYIDRNRFGYFAIRHQGSLDSFDVADALENISTGTEHLLAIAPKISELSRKEATLADVVDAKAKTSVPQSKWGAVLDRLNSEEGTLFGLFQALTAVATHELGAMRSISCGQSISSWALEDR